MPDIQCRKPTGAVPYPLILLEGGEKSGRSWAAVRLSASEKVGQTYWLDLNEGSADEYGAIPGARHLILEHDGTWAQILGQVEAVHAEAKRAEAAHEPPVVLVIDTVTAVWDGLKDWATDQALARAARKNGGRAVDPESVRITTDLWNAAGGRHKRLMLALQTFPGIAVVIARGKEVVAMQDGKPVEGKKVYKVEGHKDLAFDCSVWLRMERGRDPQVIGARSVHTGIKPGVDEPQPLPVGDGDDMLERLIFDALKVDPVASHVRDIKALDGGETTPAERGESPVIGLRDEVRTAAAKLDIASSAIKGEYATRYDGADINEADADGLRMFLADLTDEYAAMGSAE